ncbi:MAG: class I SAM-dependent methyltransferase [Candidatus Competibacteraceae bacterium]|nr:class I SAM-dependent methyltransferase [Candidatus Competibacteraceae bacterium]MBK8751850.1 class I SAM-dependent methyltransferase [Candidatus Competibacteraceae bacterium]
MDPSARIQQAVKMHYEKYVYPRFPLLSSVRRCDTYALNLDSLWARFNGKKLPSGDKKILLAGSGSFSPYPTAVANKEAKITALDLSGENLKRARLHTLIHRCFNVDFIEGDIIEAHQFLGGDRFQFIDCYGVLHHIPDAVSALNSIHAMLKTGGLLRIMVYSKYARRPAQSIRTAMKILDINEISELKKIYKKARDGSRFKEYLDSTYESKFDSGLADMFLHPYAKTYTINELLELLNATDFEPLLFIHHGALPEVKAEIERVGDMENKNELSTNFILFAGRKQDVVMRLEWETIKNHQDTVISLNPIIMNSLALLPLIPLKPESKLGFENPPINFRGKRLLSKFKKPVKKSSIKYHDDWEWIEQYLKAMFLIETMT